ncbi:Uu.00g093090.m01.CDS01 [Anthostomella pinea]|uniref:Uu.00g093090.m01.CDS01 n=1 Tax=Anthostomella pinea TaxID=933095 RepID=A0AAI8VHY0_9PEZI|nr:Uu.00g093090.m01.CDS01 [Anthostomella pinea]
MSGHGAPDGKTPAEQSLEEPKYEPIITLKRQFVESVEQYEPGGFHPINLGDTIGGRYEVFEKLGCGGYATVWLCADKTEKETKWCAVKVMASAQSSEEFPELRITRLLDGVDLSGSHIQLPSDHFWIEGPNGRHLCFVLPVLCPSIAEAIDESVGFQKEVLCQAAEGLQFLHRRGICHGDFRPANILPQLPDLGVVTKEFMREIIGESKTEAVRPLKQSDAHRAPKQLVQADQIKVRPSDQIAIIDFGVHFKVSESPEATQIPAHYAPPEAWLGIEIGPSLDIWSLACTILEVRTQGQMFFSREDLAMAESYEIRLGALPEPYNPVCKKRIQESPGSTMEVTEEGEPVSCSTEDLAEAMDEELEDEDYDEIFKVMAGKERKVWRYRRNSLDVRDRRQEQERVAYKVPEDEVPVLADLLRRSFRYEISERLDLDGILNHEWLVQRATEEASH